MRARARGGSGWRTACRWSSCPKPHQHPNSDPHQHPHPHSHPHPHPHPYPSPNPNQVVELPVAALQAGLLEHNALAAAVRALRPSGSAAAASASASAPAPASAPAATGGGAVEHSWSSLATAEEGEALRGCRVLLSRAAPDRAVPDLALWRSWLVLVRHQRREVAVVCALRKFTPPHGAAFCRLAFGAAADVDGDGDGSDEQVCTTVVRSTIGSVTGQPLGLAISGSRQVTGPPARVCHLRLITPYTLTPRQP
eukprot:scaffold56903_cov61-Phaeocystis_antarctica.AAC.4